MTSSSSLTGQLASARCRRRSNERRPRDVQRADLIAASTPWATRRAKPSRVWPTEYRPGSAAGPH